MKSILLVFVHDNKEFLPKMSFFFFSKWFISTRIKMSTQLQGWSPVEGAFQASERPGFAPALQKLKTVETIMKEGRSGQGCSLHSRNCRSRASPGKRHAPTHGHVWLWAWTTQLWSLPCADGQRVGTVEQRYLNMLTSCPEITKRWLLAQHTKLFKKKKNLRESIYGLLLWKEFSGTPPNAWFT